MLIQRLCIAVAMLPLAACGSEPAEGVGGVSASEADALNAAAARLDEQSADPHQQKGAINPAAAMALRADQRTATSPATDGPEAAH